MEINKLYSIAARQNVTVDRFSMRENASASVAAGDRLFIAIDPAISGKCEKVCLAHELGHCVTGSFYNLYSPLDIRGKHEQRANRWAIKKLVPKYRYEKAIKHGIDTIYGLAEYFEVTPDFMQKAVDYYKQENAS